mgnify:CR=1 FL=1
MPFSDVTYLGTTIRFCSNTEDQATAGIRQPFQALVDGSRLTVLLALGLQSFILVNVISESAGKRDQT